MTIRVAIAQRDMHWTVADNLASAVHALAIAGEHGAELCVFPELSLTGFHRNIRDLCIPALIAGAAAKLRTACSQSGVAAVVGLPAFSDGSVFNAVMFIDAMGVAAGEIRKNGLTAAEATLFAGDTSRPTHSFCGHRCSAVLCREIEDIDAVAAQLDSDPAELIFWPGIMRPDPTGTMLREPYIEQGHQLARRVRAHVVQANWPNSLNYPAEGAEQGHSMVIGPMGQTLLRLPKAQSGIGIFTLGSNRYDWYPD